MLSLDRVSVHYGETFALNEVSASLETGDFVGIFGLNGSGKSTLLRVIAGLEQPTSGYIHLNQQKMSPDLLKRQTVFVQDKPTLYDYLSIRENVNFACSIWGVGASETLDRLLAYGVQTDFETLAKNLSLGTRKKISYLLSTLKAAPLLIVDEPFNGLDSETVKRVAYDLQQAKDQGRTVVITTHDPEPIRDLLDREIILESGRIITT